MDNKEILLAANAAVSNGDIDGFLTYCAENSRWEFVGEQVLEGKQAIREYMSKTYHEPPKFNVSNLIAEGDFLTVTGTISIKDASGKIKNFEYCDNWRFEDGKMIELRAFVVERKNRDV